MRLQLQTRTGRLCTLPLLLALFALPQASFGQAGTLDPTFGDGGVVRTDIIGQSHFSEARAVTVVQQDGKVIVAGTNETESWSSYRSDFGLVRYNTDGTVDESFGVAGHVLTDFGSSDFGASDRVSDMLLQPDGKILVAGFACDYTYGTAYGMLGWCGGSDDRGGDFAVARYHSDGALDASFGGDGRVIIDAGYPDSQGAHALALQSDGMILLGGHVQAMYSWGRMSGIPAIVRLNADGSLDATFGGGGVVAAGTLGDGSIVDLAVQADDKIVAVTGTGSPSDRKHSVDILRFTADGSLDPGFGAGGVATHGVGGDYVWAAALSLDHSGRILVAGKKMQSGRWDMFAMRLEADGSMDLSFGAEGVATYDGGSRYEHAYDMAVEPDGGIVLAGTTNFYDWFGGDMVVSRFSFDGILDPGFGTGGAVINDLGDAFAVALGPDSEIYAAGKTAASYSGGPRSYFVARYDRSGALDASFGDGGVVKGQFLVRSWSAVAQDVIEVQADGKILAAGYMQGTSTRGPALARYNRDGTLDPTFGYGGSIILPVRDGAQSIAVQSDGKIVVQTWRALIRLESNGDFDLGFGTEGVVYQGIWPCWKRCMHLQADGKIVVGGNYALARFNEDGTPDQGFGDAGHVDLGAVDVSVETMALQSDGSIVAVGSRWHPQGWSVVTARVLPDGTTDANFGSDGVWVSDPGGDAYARSAAVQPDDKIVLVGDYPHNFMAMRLTSDGQTDLDFGAGGVTTTDFGGPWQSWAVDVAVQADGRIVVAGETKDYSACPWTHGYNRPDRGLGLARYNSDGSPDETFGEMGMVHTDLRPDGADDCDYEAQANGVHIQSDGKILVAVYGRGTGQPYQFVVARFEGLTSPIVLIENLIADIEALAEAGLVNNGQANSMLVKLQAAAQQLDRDNIPTAINQLNAFINHVEAFIDGGVLTAADGQPLIDQAQQIINQLMMGKLEELRSPIAAVSAVALPETYNLSGNYPNPFNPATTLTVDLPQEGEVSLKVYNVLGREVRRLMTGIKPAGSHRVTFDAGGLPSGLYVARLETGGGTFTRQMTLIK